MSRRLLYIGIALMAAVCCCGTVSAQFTIKPQNEQPRMDRNDMLSGIQLKELDKEYFDRAAFEAERRRLRHERNTINFQSSLETSFQQFDNWTTSGSMKYNMTLTVLAKINFQHTYKKDKFNYFYKFTANYGMNYIDDIVFKNIDNFEISGNTGWALNDSWSYAANVGLKSQFGKNEKSRTDKTLVSDFMAPGELNVGLGFSFAKPKGPLRINFSPINGKVITVFNKELRDNHKFDKEGKKFISSLGVRLEVFYNKSFGKKKNFLYDTKFTLTSSYKDMWNPTTSWDNTVSYQFTRHLKASLLVKYYYEYNRGIEVGTRNKWIQSQYLFTLGFSMNYKNK